MVQILVIGATGFIGTPVSLALRRAGHIVHGLVRDPSSPASLSLARQEVLIIKGDAKDGSTWVELASKVDVVIDCADTMLGADVFKVVLEAAKKRPEGAPKLTFIYTCGVWSHGDSRKQVTDVTPLPGVVTPKLITSWRPAFERQVLSISTREFLEPLVIRPGVVFGGASTVYSTWFNPLLEAHKSGSKTGEEKTKIKIPGKKDTLVATVHKEDLAQAYKLLVEKSTLLSSLQNPIFDIVNPPESLQQLITAASYILFPPSAPSASPPVELEFWTPSASDEGGILEALSTSVNGSSERARDILGWQARHPSMTAGMEVYLKAMLAHR